MEKRYRKHSAIMLTCFIAGGFSVMLYAIQAYSVIWRADAAPAANMSGGNFSAPVFSQSPVRENNSMPGRRGLEFANPASFLFSPFSVALLAVGVSSLLGGLSIWALVREKEIVSAKKKILDAFLLPAEKIVLDRLKKSGGLLTQNELAGSTGFSRVKVHRIIKNLERKELVTKQQYGMTNKIALKN